MAGADNTTLVDEEDIYAVGNEGIRIWGEVIELWEQAAHLPWGPKKEVLYKQADTKTKEAKRMFEKFEELLEAQRKLEPKGSEKEPQGIAPYTL